jgi:toxin ParE1/3/4
MLKYRLTRLSNRDLNEIWEFTFHKWSIKQADKYYDLLIETFNQITLDPNCGKNYDGVEPKLRGFKTGKHIVFYELIDNNTIEISRILHQSMDVKKRLKK